MDSCLYDERMGHYGIANLSPAAGDTEAWCSDQVGAAAARDEIAMSKFHGAPQLNRILDRAFQVHGALDFSGDFPLARPEPPTFTADPTKSTGSQWPDVPCGGISPLKPRASTYRPAAPRC
jgi:hypothetical protein